MQSPNHFPNIVNVERTTVLRMAREFSQTQNWGESKKNIYVAMMSHLAGLGYYSGLSLATGADYVRFGEVRQSVLKDLNKRYIHGGMPYEDAHRLITGSESFQSINC